MNSKQESRQSMYLTADDYLSVNTDKTQNLPNFAGYYATFSGAVAGIREIAEIQLINRTGVAADKLKLRENLALTAVDTSRKLVAFATVTDNSSLLKEVRFSETELRRCTDTKLISAADLLYKRAETHLGNLDAYGLNADTQKKLSIDLKAFEASIPKPRRSLDDRSMSTAQLRDLFATADKALTNIDVLMGIVRASQPDFYNGYMASRRVIQTGKNSLAVKGKVIEADGGEGVSGVKLLFVQTEGGEANYEKVTSEKGGFMIRSLPAGLYNVTAQKPGYLSRTVTLAVAENERAELNISLGRI